MTCIHWQLTQLTDHLWKSSIDQKKSGGKKRFLYTVKLLNIRSTLVTTQNLYTQTTDEQPSWHTLWNPVFMQCQLYSKSINVQCAVWEFWGSVLQCVHTLDCMLAHPLLVHFHASLHFTLGIAKLTVHWSCLSVCVCLSLAACRRYCTYPDVTWWNDRGCPVVVHYWADLQSVHEFRCYGNIRA